MSEPMTTERINELRAAAHVQSGADPARSYISVLLHAHGAVVGECLDEIERLRGWMLRVVNHNHDWDPLAALQRGLDGDAVPS